MVHYMERGAPNKRGLDYFPKMVNFYEDDKIFDLLDEYGPLGVTIYDCILTIVYSNGYYANLSKDKLSRMVIRKIGNKWIKGQKVVVQVIDYCADLGLLCKDLMLQDIITSVGIQKRYYKIAVKLMKRRLYSNEYWLLDENGESLLNAPSDGISSEENRIDSKEMSHVSEESPQKEKESKGKEIKEGERCPLSGKYQNVRLEDAERAALEERFGARTVSDYTERLSWHMHNTGRQYKDHAGTMEKWIQENLAKQKEAGKPKNQFHNFEQRDTDYDALVMQRLNERLHGDGGKTDG